MADQLEIIKKGHLTHAPVGKTHFRPVKSSTLIHAHSVHWEEGAMKARLRAREEYEAMRKECGSKIRPEVAEAHHAAVYNKWEEHSAKREHTNLNQGSKERQIKELKYKLEREGKDISNFKFEEKVTFMQYKEQMFDDYQRMRRQVGLPESRYIPPEEDLELKKKNAIHEAEKRRKHEKEMLAKEKKAMQADL